MRALQAWLQQAEIHRGPVFRQMRRGDKLTDRRLSDQSVALIVNAAPPAAGLPPELLSGHSLRAGYATAAATAGVEERKIANVTRHKNITVLRGYIRRATAFDDSAKCCRPAPDHRATTRREARSGAPPRTWDRGELRGAALPGFCPGWVARR